MNKYEDLEPINIASGEEVSLAQLANMIKTATGYSGDIIWDITKPTGTLAKGLDITKITNLGWQPKYPLGRSIPLVVEQFKNLT